MQGKPPYNFPQKGKEGTWAITLNLQLEKLRHRIISVVLSGTQCGSGSAKQVPRASILIPTPTEL